MDYKRNRSRDRDYRHNRRDDYEDDWSKGRSRNNDGLGSVSKKPTNTVMLRGLQADCSDEMVKPH